MGKSTKADTVVANTETAKTEAAVIPTTGATVIPTTEPTVTTTEPVVPSTTEPTVTTTEPDLLENGTDVVLTEEELEVAKEASKDVDEAIRISKMTQEEINEEFGPTETEGVAFLRATIMKAGGPHMDRKLGLLQKIEDAIQY